MLLKGTSDGGSTLSRIATTLRFHKCARFRKRGVSCPFSLGGLESEDVDEGDVLEELSQRQALRPAGEASARMVQQYAGSQLGTLFSPSIMPRVLPIPIQRKALPKTPNVAISAAEAGQFSTLMEVDPIQTKLIEIFERVPQQLKQFDNIQQASMFEAEAGAIQAIQPWLLNEASNLATNLRSSADAFNNFDLEGVGETLYAEALGQVENSFKDSPPLEIVDDTSINLWPIAIAVGSISILTHIMDRYVRATITPIRSDIQTKKAPRVKGAGPMIRNMSEWMDQTFGGLPRTESPPQPPIQFGESGFDF